METKSYGIGKLFTFSFGLDVLLLGVLFTLSFLRNGLLLEKIVLTAFLIPSLYVLCEIGSRKVVLNAQGIRLEKFLRSKEVKWSEITNVGALVLHSRAYLLLTTVKGFISISNVYENFANLLQDIVEHLDPEKVEEEVRGQISFPQANRHKILKIWIAAFVMMILIVFKMFY